MQPTPESSKRSRPQREEGAVMLFVMMMLLVGTTIATMTVHAVSLEIRSSGYYRQQAQTHYTAEAALQGVLSLPPGNVYRLVHEREAQAIVAEAPDVTNLELVTNYGEPDPAGIAGGGKRVVNLPKKWVEDALVVNPAGGGVAVSEGWGNSLGYQSFRPWYVVHLSDYQVESEAIPGQDTSGNAENIYVNATVTVRGRTFLEIGGTWADPEFRGASSTVDGDKLQRFTDGAYDMRAVVRFGPVK